MSGALFDGKTGVSYPSARCGTGGSNLTLDKVEVYYSRFRKKRNIGCVFILA